MRFVSRGKHFFNLFTFCLKSLFLIALFLEAIFLKLYHYAFTFLFLFSISFSANAVVRTVSNTADAGAGSLRQAITDANTSSGDTIVFTIGANQTIGPFVTQLPALVTSMTIDTSSGVGAANLTISSGVGVAATCPFFIYNGNINIIGSGPAGLTLLNGSSTGGTGGGGALGAGGAAFVNGSGTNGLGATAVVTFTDVNFTNNAALGGNGTVVGPANNVGGGGMLRGNGAIQVLVSGSGGGGVGGAGGTIVLAGTAGIISGAPSGGAGGGVGTGGGASAGGGGGGSGGTGGGGGGAAGTAGGATNGGAGGFGGGGGSANGGGGSIPGDGGFGGGSGNDGTNNVTGTPGFGGGPNGFGGTALGGSVFVAQGGSVTFQNSAISTNTFTGGTVTAGAPAPAVTAITPAPAGTAIYLQTATETATFNVNTGLTQTVNGSIAGLGIVSKTGAGTLSLPNANSYSGGTTLTAGTLQIGNAGSLGTGTINFNGGTLTTTGVFTLANNFIVTGNSTIDSGNNITFNGTGTLNSGTTLTISNTGITAFDGVVTGSGNLALGSGSLVELAGAGTTLGGTISGSANSELDTLANVTLNGPVNNVTTIDVVDGTLTLNNNVTGFTTFELSGSNSAVFVGADNITIAGPINSTLPVPNNTSFTIGPNINFSTKGTITNIANITNSSGSVFTVNNPLTGFTTFTNNGRVIDNSNITGNTFNNNGILTFSSAGSMTVTMLNNPGRIEVPVRSAAIPINGQFIQPAGGVLAVDIQNTSSFGRIGVAGNSSISPSSTLQVNVLNNGAEIFNGDLFTVVNGIASTPQLAIQNGGPFLTFVYNNGPNTTTLRAVRTIPAPPAFQGLANVLAQSNLRNALLSGINSQTSQAGLNTIFNELAPLGLSGGMYAEAYDMMNYSLEKAFVRRKLYYNTVGMIGSNNTSSLNGLYAKDVVNNIKETGYAAGDMSDSHCTYGPFAFGNNTKQKTKNNVSGYTVLMGGVGLLADTPVWGEYVRLGLAASYSGATIRQDDITGNSIIVNNVLGALYGSAEYGPLFGDGALTVGNNWYHGKRNILIVNQTAISNFRGSQYGAKARFGFSINYSIYEVSPMGLIQYFSLNQGSYNESGAPLANLAVAAQRANGLRMGIGGRLMDVSQPDEFLPEIHAFYTVDVKQPNLIVTSRFIDGGPSFVVQGPIPPKEGVNVGASITAMLTDRLLMTFAYDLETKKRYISNSASFKFRFLF